MAKWVVWEELESQSSVVSQEGEHHHLSDRGAHPQLLTAEIVSSPQLVVLLGIRGLSAQAGAFF